MIDFEDAPGSGVTHLRLVKSPTQSAHAPAFVLALNDRQKEAVLLTEGPLIVLAGAGSGKTKMLTSRIAYLISRGVVPHSILAVTFTNKAAHEMRARVERALEGVDGRLGAPEIGTFHSVCLRILRREIQYTPYTKAFVIYDDADQLSLIKGVVHKLGIDDKTWSAKSFQSAINRAKCDALTPQEMEPSPHNFFEKQLKRVYEQYQTDLFANNAIDFGEILCMTYRLFVEHSDVRARYQHRYRYIHVDEYQDTNRAQYLLLSVLAGKTWGGHNNICVVGDEDQSIYKWRGADIKNILDFEQDYPGAAVVKLEQNYRSTQTIITAASQVIANNTQRKDKRLWTENETGVPIVHLQLADERAEAEMVVSEIKRQAQYEDRTYQDFSIFYRTHAQSRQFEDVLRREKIPYQIVGGLRFYDRKEIKDILAYFRVILNPSDSISIKRIINTPARGIGKTTLDRLDELHLQPTDSGQLLSYWEMLEKESFTPRVLSSATARKIQSFVVMMQKLMAEQPRILLSELYHLILDETGYVRELRKEGTEEATSRIENLEEFDTLLQEFEDDQRVANSPEQRGRLLEIFLEQSALNTEVDGAGRGGMPAVSAVHMMSLHSSKGLEFPVVFLVGMEEGLFPSVRPWEATPDDEFEEERRLCYVGMTRARQKLYLSNVVMRRLWGNVAYQEPARFFAEISDDLMEFRDLSHGPESNRYRTGSSRAFQSQWGGQVPAKEGRGHSAMHDDFSQVSDHEHLPQSRTGSNVGHDQSTLGQRLKHPDYGLGKVVSSEGTGDDIKVVIEFSGRDRRKFLLRFVRQYFEGSS